MNKEEVPQNLNEELQSISTVIRASANPGLMVIFKSKRLMCNIALVTITWLVNDFFYKASQLNSTTLEGNQFWNFIITALTELPACFIGQFLINNFGRRWSHVACMTLSALPYIICVLLLAINPDDSGSAIRVLALTSRVASNVGTYIVWVQAIEVIPTSARATGLNIVTIVTKISLIPVPHLILVGVLPFKRYLLGMCFIAFSCCRVTGHPC